MRSGVRSWEITHEPGLGHVTPVGRKNNKNETGPQGKEGGKILK